MKKNILFLFLLSGLLFTVFPQTVLVNEVMSSNGSTLKDEDKDYSDWIELYNTTSSAINLGGYCISDDAANKFQWVLPAVNIDAHGFLILFASGKNRSVIGANLHTNFSLSKKGDTVYFVNSSGQVLDEFVTGELPLDVSKGRFPDGSLNFASFLQATPGSANNTNSYFGVAGSPQFSTPGGYHSGSVNLTLSVTASQEKIHYTLDGSTPTESSTLYTVPIKIDTVTVVKARAFRSAYIPGNTVTNTYLINKNFTMPVISISTDPANLWDEQNGIYVKGDSAESVFPYMGANFWQDWEKPVHMELYETTGQLSFSMDLGIRIYGGWTRAFDEKSLAVYARDIYGDDRINYKFFPNRSTTKFKSFVLRDGGQDWEGAMMRDAMMQSLVEDADLDVQAYRPAIVFLNGAYWGIHDIRERLNEDFIAEHHNVDTKKIDLLKLDAEALTGNNNNYNDLLDFLDHHDPLKNKDYDSVKAMMDVNNFMKYYVSEIYCDNGDWPGSNIEFWREQSSKGKWRWIFYDTDYGFGMYDDKAYLNNTLDMATIKDGPDWPNPNWSTFLIRKLLTNDEFKNDFINYFADFSNSYFVPDTVVKKINIIKNLIQPEIEAHQLRWGRTLQQWQQNVQVLYDFANNRLENVRNHFVQKFNLSGLSDITLNVSDKKAGNVEINKLNAPHYPWTGKYFNIPVELTAHPKSGYHFARWSGITAADSQKIDYPLNGNVTVTAVFEPDSDANGSVVINEINYHSANDFDTKDWIELYNRTDNTLDISGYQFRDSDDAHSFTLPHNSFILPKNYLVICEDDTAFTSHFPGISNITGNLGYGLGNNGELLRLYDVQSNLVDAVTYNDKAPWPLTPDGNGATLSLVSSDSNNAIPSNWKSSKGHGTPAAQNDFATAVENEKNIIPQFRLLQNYPNPFNPSTTINFEIPSEGKVTIKLFDILGNEVRTILNEYRSRGTYNIVFNGANLPSGVYIYQLRFNNNVDRKKFILLK